MQVETLKKFVNWILILNLGFEIKCPTVGASFFPLTYEIEVFLLFSFTYFFRTTHHWNAPNSSIPQALQHILDCFFGFCFCSFLRMFDINITLFHIPNHPDHPPPRSIHLFQICKSCIFPRFASVCPVCFRLPIVLCWNCHLLLLLLLLLQAHMVMRSACFVACGWQNIFMVYSMLLQCCCCCSCCCCWLLAKICTLEEERPPFKPIGRGCSPSTCHSNRKQSSPVVALNYLSCLKCAKNNNQQIYFYLSRPLRPVLAAHSVRLVTFANK